MAWLESKAMWKLSARSVIMKVVEWQEILHCVYSGLVEAISCMHKQELLIRWERLAASAGPERAPDNDTRPPS